MSDDDRFRGSNADEQSLSDLDQSVADSEQTEADLDQTTADADQSASDRDQLAADRDQLAADLDQRASEIAAPQAAGADHARTRRTRALNAIERDTTSQARSKTARLRGESAGRRDVLGEQRDATARARDELAARLDAELEELSSREDGTTGEPVLARDLLLRAAGDRRRAAVRRELAAAQRAAAAENRRLAAEDRRRAAADRASAAAEIALEGVDHLTGALRRRAGLAAIRRELDRTQRTGQPLTIAFVDVHGLKVLNDGLGHGAGDQLLRAVVKAIRDNLRSDDVIARYGGDEFVCSLAGHDARGAGRQFEKVAARLADSTPGARITLGFAERQPDDSLEALIGRAVATMVPGRRGAAAPVSRI